MNVDVPGSLPPELARATMIKIMEDFETHPIRSAEGFRNAALDGLFAFSPMLDIPSTSAGLVNTLIDTVQRTIREGRMIDFGFLPNSLLKETSTRTRDVFEAGELQHPYDEWIGVSSWEGGMCGYFVSPFSEGRASLVVEIYGVASPGMPLAVVVNDICAISVEDGETVMINPAPMVDPVFNRQPEVGKRGANMLDPLVTMLRLLADASVPVLAIPAPAKLNKQRTLKGKLPIPAHTRVETRDYVSLFQNAVASIKRSQRGHHASPVPHWRRGHQRHLASGRVVPVRSTKVNWRDHEELHRLFTRVKP